MGIEFDWKKVETCESFQVIPKRKQEEVLKRYQGGEICHWGRDRMIAAMRRDGIYWFGQWEDCRKFIKRCEICSRDDCKKTHEEPINSIESTKPHERLQIDLITIGKENADNLGRCVALTAVDCHSKFCWGKPLYSKKANKVADAVLDIYI